MGYILLLILIIVLVFLLIKKQYGYIACLALLFFRLVSTILYSISPILFQYDSYFLLALYFILLSVQLPHLDGKYIASYYKNPIVWSTCVMACIMLVYNATSEYHALYPDVVKDVQNSYFINVFFPFLFIPFFVQRKDISSFVDAIPMWGVINLFVLMITFRFDFGSIFQDRAILYESSNELVGTIQLARTSCITLLALVIMSFQRKIQKRPLLIMIAFACVSLFFLLGAGQRGMLIGFILSLLLLLLNNKWRRSLIPIYGVLITLLLVAGLLIDFGRIEIFQRFSQFNDLQSFNRYWDYGNTWEIFRENGYFYGLGTKGYFFQTGRIYPHNIILEHISDYGLIGLICILVLIICCLKYSVKTIRYSFSYQSIIIASCWIALCFEAMVSDGINGQRMFYLFSGLLALCDGGKSKCDICCKENVTLSS